jgi:ribosome maturation protein SDO1
MVDIDKAIIASYEVRGEKFEILIDPKVTEKLKEGVDVEIVDYMAIDTIFKDSKKGTRASEDKIREVFGTTDIVSVAKQIILKGRIQVTTEQRRAMQENKRKQIISIIARNSINPRTGTPHPPQRIEIAMNEAKIHVDPFKPVETQVKEVLEKLRPILPIRFEKIKIAVKLSGEDYGKCYGDIKSFGTILKEEWLPNGFWIGLVELPAGVQTDFFNKLNEKTKGNLETRTIK